MSRPEKPQQASLASLPTLSSDQQRLLLAALSSNNRTLNMHDFHNELHSAGTQAIFKNNLGRTQSPTQGVSPRQVFSDSNPDTQTPTDSPNSYWKHSGHDVPTFGDPLLPDFSNGYSTDFDVDLPQDVLDSMLAVAKVEKRKSPEDEDEDEDDDAKRREGEDKTPRKPGRKPLTVEPTTKRKAQNRAAQRAFRERKEQHLKDLEQKINDLQASSESANNENSLLRAQVMTLQAELQSYKKRLSMSGGVAVGALHKNHFGFLGPSPATSTPNPFDFNFDAPSSYPTYSTAHDTNYQTPTDGVVSPATSDPPVKQEQASRSNSNSISASSVASLSSKSRSPSLLTGINNGGGVPGQTFGSSFTIGGANLESQGYGFPQFGSPINVQSQSSPQTSTSRSHSQGQVRSHSESTTSHAPSPTSSSMSRLGPSSSCGTSPEPMHDGNRRDISTGSPDLIKSPLGDLSDFQFDPSLFGGYRETQDAIFGDGDFTGGLYDDFLNTSDLAFDVPGDGVEGTISATDTLPMNRKPIEGAVVHQEAGPKDQLPTSKSREDVQMITTNKMWQQLQTCPKFQQGELDIDGLCSELSKKATCSESGASIPKDEWEAALWRMVGQPEGARSRAP